MKKTIRTASADVLLSMKQPINAISFVLHVHVNLTDKTEVKKYASSATGRQVHSIEDAILTSMIQMEDVRGGPGFQITGVSVAQAKAAHLRSQWVLVVRGIVDNEADLLAATRKRTALSCFDPDWTPENLGDLVHEYLFISNSAPTPSDIGIAYCDFHAQFIDDEIVA